MKRLMVCLITSTLLVSLNVGAKDIGVVGHTFSITEINMIDWLKAKFNRLVETGEWEKINNQFIDDVKKHAIRPIPVQGITTTVKPRTYTVDPTITVKKNVYGADGQIVVPKGRVVNPFKEIKHKYRWKWAFINADDNRQIEWAKNVLNDYPDSVKVVLVNGDVSIAGQKLKHKVYFDQGGFYTDKLSIRHVPSLAKEDNFLWLVQEFSLGLGQ
ncbi:type-F conjugative transfer system protein TraW [Vibrio fluvialis]|nr:type-F conjugative transfer system protein TraW [Vibrio fluvialis]